MKRPDVFEVIASEDTELCHPRLPTRFDDIIAAVEDDPAFSGRPSSALRVRLVRKNNGKSLLYSDAPYLIPDALVLRASAELPLGDILRTCGRVLPLSCSAADLSLFVPSASGDCFDESKSAIVRLPSGGIMSIDRYVWNPAGERIPAIFKIRFWPTGPVLVSSVFVERWRGAGLKGLDFKRIER